MQIEWSDSGTTLPAMVGDGMAIWGSEEAGLGVPPSSVSAADLLVF